MARKTRVVAAAAGAAGLLALVVAVTRDTGTRRRLGGLPTHALLPEHQRMWVHPAGQLAHHHVRIDTHRNAERPDGTHVGPLTPWRAASPITGPARLRERAFDCIDAGDLGALRPACVLCRGRPPEGED